MSTRRVILTVAGVLFLIPAFFFLTTDLFVGDVNCGTAMVPRDTDALVLQTGDLIEDDFAAEALRGECSQRVFRNRVITIGMVGLAVALFVAASRSKPKDERFPGDPIV